MPRRVHQVELVLFQKPPESEENPLSSFSRKAAVCHGEPVQVSDDAILGYLDLRWTESGAEPIFYSRTTSMNGDRDEYQHFYQTRQTRRLYGPDLGKPPVTRQDQHMVRDRPKSTIHRFRPRSNRIVVR